MGETENHEHNWEKTGVVAGNNSMGLWFAKVYECSCTGCGAWTMNRFEDEDHVPFEETEVDFNE